MKRARCAWPVAFILLAACGPQAPATTTALRRDGRVVEVPSTAALRQTLQLAVAAQTVFERPISVAGVIEVDPSRQASMSTVWFSARVPQSDLAAVYVGQPAWVVANAGTPEPLAGRVAHLDDLRGPDARAWRIRITVDNAGARLRPGLAATAVFSAAAHEVVTVPASALTAGCTGTCVFVERAPWTFEARSVTAGARIGSQVEIATGLQAGERVVVSDAALRLSSALLQAPTEPANASPWPQPPASAGSAP